MDSITASGSNGQPATQYTLGNLIPNHRYSVWIRPSYYNDVWGTFSEPVHFVYKSLDYRVISIGEDRVFLKWKPCIMTEEDRESHKGCPDKIIVSVRQVLALPSEDPEKAVVSHLFPPVLTHRERSGYVAIVIAPHTGDPGRALVF